MIEVIAYHGTDKDITKFELPEKTGVRYRMSMLGIFFTTNKELARCYCKEKWYCKNSKYRKNSKIYTVKLKIFNPHYLLPVEGSLLSNLDKEKLYTYRLYLQAHYNFDSIIKSKKKNTEFYNISKDPTKIKLPYICEYSEHQYVMFDPDNIEILKVEPIRHRKIRNIKSKILNLVEEEI